MSRKRDRSSRRSAGRQHRFLAVSGPQRAWRAYWSAHVLSLALAAATVLSGVASVRGLWQPPALPPAPAATDAGAAGPVDLESLGPVPSGRSSRADAPAARAGGQASSRGSAGRAPSPTPAPTEAPPEIVTYQVVAGDTLAGLAQRFGISPETIVWANDLEDENEPLQAGQELAIPPVSGVLYTVKSGDTLSEIASVYGVATEAIAEANGLDAPDLLSVDQQLVIPGARPVQPTPAPAATAQPPTAQPEEAELAPPPVPEDASKGQEIVAIAASFVGYPYRHGGSSPSTGFDCSGFTWYVCQQAGVPIPNHDMPGQLNAGPRVQRGELLPGDLVFFANTYKAGLSHTGIYVGEGRFVHAARPGYGVRYDVLDDAYWGPRFYGASRPWQ